MFRHASRSPWLFVCGARADEKSKATWRRARGSWRRAEKMPGLKCARGQVGSIRLAGAGGGGTPSASSDAQFGEPPHVSGAGARPRPNQTTDAGLLSRAPVAQIRRCSGAQHRGECQGLRVRRAYPRCSVPASAGILPAEGGTPSAGISTLSTTAEWTCPFRLTLATS